MTRRWLLPLADALALTTFVLVGLVQHVEGFAFHLIARNLGPLLIAWFVLGTFLRMYPRPEPATFVLTWITSVSAAVGVRSLWIGHPTGSRLVAFLLVTLGFTLLSVAVFRGLAWFVDRALDLRGVQAPEG